jgi:hypothetical protein
MRALLLALAVLAAAFFIYRYHLSGRDRRLTHRWGARVLVSLAVAALVLIASFVLSASTTWRFF